MRATVYENVFENVNRRSPRASELSHVHVLNNVVADWGDNACDDGKSEAFGASSMSGAQMLLENNFFRARPGSKSCKVAMHVDGGFVKAVGNVADNGAIVHSSFPAKVFDPRDPAQESYDYAPAPMNAKLRQEIESAAGPRP